MSSERLPRRWCLTRKSEIRAVLSQGKRHHSPHADIFWISTRRSHPRLAVIVPRHGESAVARNRLRRRVREICRTRIMPRVGSYDLAVRTRPSAYRVGYQVLLEELTTWLNDLSN